MDAREKKREREREAREKEKMAIEVAGHPGPDPISPRDIIIPGESPHLAVILVITCC